MDTSPRTNPIGSHQSISHTNGYTRTPFTLINAHTPSAPHLAHHIRALFSRTMEPAPRPNQQPIQKNFFFASRLHPHSVAPYTCCAAARHKHQHMACPHSTSVTLGGTS